MGFRNLGPNVSEHPTEVTPGGGGFTAEDHSFESVVFQSGKPPLDWELNLLQEALGSYGFRSNNQKIFPSSWITGSYLNSSSPSDYIFLTPDPPSATMANKFNIVALDAILNGWMIRFEYSDTQTSGMNRINLPSPPSSGVRTDLVILEIWRALVSPSPDGTNKSPSGQILRFGNAKAPDSTGNQNLLDDILDPTYLVETSKRVQVQYRYRVIPGISNLSSTPDGLNDAAVVANTVPYKSLSTVDGVATLLTYVESSVDSGLWVAGSGSSGDATTLGTVDGRIYAVPICAVFRRNSTAFNRSTNLNGGGLMASSVSGRPDGLYCDQIVAGDVKDLRKSYAYDLKEIVEKTFNQVLDNSLVTEHEYSADGPAGVTFLARDNMNGSDHIGGPDSVRTHFSDRSSTESVVCKFTNSGAPTSTITIALSSLPIYHSASPVSVGSLAPTGTNIVGIGRIRFHSTASTSDYDMLDSSSTIRIKKAVMSASPGPSVDSVVLTTNVSVPTGDSLYVELYVEYPSGSGMHRNIVTPNQFWTPPAANISAWIDSSTLSATSDGNRKMLSTSLWWTNNSHRELSVKLKSTSQSFTTYWDGVDTLSNPASTYVPDTVTGPVTLAYTSLSGAESYSTSSYEFNAGFTKVTIDPTKIPVSTGTTITITYTALRAIPPLSGSPGDSYQIFYQTRSIQSIAIPSGTQTLNLIPRSVSSNLHVITSGSGSPDDSFPFDSPSSQIPVGSLPSVNFPESILDTPSVFSMSGFVSNTGYCQVPVYTPYVPDPDQVTLYKDVSDQTTDGDGRNFWPKSDNGITPKYSPVVSGQTLLNKQKHKTAYPVLMELKQNFSSIGRKGTLVLVVFSKWFDFSDQNSINFTSSLSDSCAAVYRVNGNMMNLKRN